MRWKPEQTRRGPGAPAVSALTGGSELDKARSLAFGRGRKDEEGKKAKKEKSQKIGGSSFWSLSQPTICQHCDHTTNPLHSGAKKSNPTQFNSIQFNSGA